MKAIMQKVLHRCTFVLQAQNKIASTRLARCKLVVFYHPLEERAGDVVRSFLHNKAFPLLLIFFSLCISYTGRYCGNKILFHTPFSLRFTPLSGVLRAFSWYFRSARRLQVSSDKAGSFLHYFFFTFLFEYTMLCTQSTLKKKKLHLFLSDINYVI